jgi:hypothetical protein
MKSMKIVNLFTLFLRIVFVVNVIAIIVLIAFALHSSFFPDVYKKVEIKSANNKYTLSYTNVRSNTGMISNDNHPMAVYFFTEQKLATRLQIIATMLAQLTLLLLVIKELLKFTSTLKKPHTIFRNNSLCFRRISIYLGIYILLTFLLSFFPVELFSRLPNDVFIDNAFKTISTKTYSFNVDFLLIVGLIVSLLLSGVFKEAERLRAENELTI